MAAASHMLCQLAGQPINPDPLMHLPVPQYEAQLARLQEREELKYGSSDGVGVDLQDVSIFPDPFIVLIPEAADSVPLPCPSPF